MNKKTEQVFDDYVHETFEAYTRNKKSIEIHLKRLSYVDESLYSLIVHALKWDHLPKDENDKTNLVKPVLSKLFPNAKSVHITASEYPFSLFALSPIIRM